MPYRDIKQRRNACAVSMRRARAYQAAVKRGDPKALEAERAKDYMRPFNELWAEKDRLPKGGAERERLKTAPSHERLSSANLMRVSDECKAAGKTGSWRKRYLELRAEAIAEAEIFS